MKKLAWLLALIMLLSCVSGAFAEESSGAPAGDAPAEEPVGANQVMNVRANQVMNVRANQVDPEVAAAEQAFLEGNCEFSVIEADEATGQKKLSYIEGVTPILEVDGLKFKDLNKNGALDVYEDWRVDTDTRIADLISQMTPEEEVGLLFCVNTQLYDARNMVKEYALTCQLFNLNGTPITITNTLNNLQAAAEAERLGVPMVFTSDREYNSFGGYIDKAHEGFGTANDPELAYQLACFYGKAMEDADVVVGDFGTINDATELFIEDAQDAEKPIVLTLNCTKPTQFAIESADALLYLSYSQGADHGSTEGGFITGTAPWVYADLIFGDRQPGGVINKEIARDVTADNEQWKDLAGDQGASPYVRLIVQALMEDDPNHAAPINYGDPLVTYQFGMSYGQDPEFKYSCLIVPVTMETKEVESGSSTTTQTTVWNQAKAGEPFTVYCLLRNTGADGLTTAQAKLNGEVVAEKIMTVEGGSWRVVQMDITVDAPGDYTIEIGDAVNTIKIAE